MGSTDTIDLRHEIRRCPECNERFRQDACFCPFDGSSLVPDRYTPPAKDALIGTVGDARYEVRKVLGEGGTGTVYEVRHVTLGRAAAMKVLRADLAQEPELGARFLQEAQATAAIKHPGVVSILDFGRLPDARPYFVMELLVGQTLADALHRGGPAPVKSAVTIAVRIAEALAAAHAAGVVHRDLKPENIYLVGGVKEDAEVRVVDFGAAVILGRSRLTKKGIVFGTPHYMAPEQAAGHDVDHRTDVYAIGILLYEMLTGRVPFEGDNYMGILTQHMFAEPTPPSRVRPERANELGILEAVVLRALAKDPDARFASMDDLATTLRATLVPGRADAPTDPPMLPRKPSSPRAIEGDQELPTTTEIQQAMDHVEPPPARGWTRALALGALAAAVVVLVVAFVVRRTPVHAAQERASSTTSATTAPLTTTSATPPTAAAVASRRITLRADVDAQLYLGAALVGPLPIDLTVRDDDAPKVYSVRANGYAAQDVLVAPQSPSAIAIKLERAAKGAPPPPTSSSPSGPPASAAHHSSDLYDPWK
ncbi:hypothetical protein BH09MYX1_BH09MYX1_33280 [soil metagenome]